MRTVGIKLADGSFYPIMEEGSAQKKTLELTTAHNNQTCVMVDLYRSKTCSMEDAEYIDTLKIENLVEHPNGEPSISFDVDLDENGELSYSIADPETGKTSNSEITLVSRTVEERLQADDYSIEETPAEETAVEETAVEEDAPAEEEASGNGAAIAAGAAVAGAGLLAAAAIASNKKDEAEETTVEEEAPVAEDDFTIEDEALPDFEETPATEEAPASDDDFTVSEDTLPDFDETTISDEPAPADDDTTIADDSFEMPDFDDNTMEAEQALLSDTDDSADLEPPVATTGGMDFTGLYDKETEMGNPSENQEDDFKKKTRAPVIICIICAIICLVATILILLVLPTKFNLRLKHSQKAAAQETVVEKTEEKKPDPVPAAKEDEVVVIEKAEDVKPLPPPAAETKPAGVTYKIKWGDTLWDIADTYYKNPWRYKKIASYNNIKNPDHIISGTVITIPSE